MLYTETQNTTGLLLLVDFEKAFESISWSFINQVPDIFNFKNSIKRLINTLYKNASAVLQSGFMSDQFIIGRACRQRYPL